VSQVLSLCRFGRLAAEFTSCAGIGRWPEHRKAPPVSLRFLAVLMAGCGEMVEASRDEVAEFDEQHREFLVMTELKIADIVKLAHLISPAKWSGLKIPAGKAIIFTPRFGQLKNHVIFKRIKGHHTHRHEAIIDYAALISLADLLAFLETAGPEWDWLRSFAARWQKFCRSGARYGKRRKRKEDADVSARKNLNTSE
jgi:hypothetical protein